MTDNTIAKRKWTKRTNNNLLNITYKTKGRVTKTLLKTDLCNKSQISE